MYSIKEIFYTLQGEGARSGRAAVFLRFAGCNLWSGREQDRETAICSFCDTDFIGTDGENGGKYTTEDLGLKVASLWPQKTSGNPYVVCTGGEPLLQLDIPLIEELHKQNFEIAIETNGTLAPPAGIDWICMSPKPNTQIVIQSGNEIKFIYPQNQLDPLRFQDFDFEHFYIQPMDNAEIKNNIQEAIRFCQSHPKWKLSLQTHKIIGIK